MASRAAGMVVLVMGLAPAALAAQGRGWDRGRDSTEALALFRENIDAIHKRDRARYLATYLQSTELVRTGLRVVERGFEGWGARTSNAWPDTLVANELEVHPLQPGVVYGRYRYVGVNQGVAATGVSERFFVRTPQGWRIAVTGSFPDTLAAPRVPR
ncbi:MAG: hypothetical protein NW201_06805 [Gemmatimonadales bacterium]|nr:hypothetical protein [Gemmatimonadales bacterium]